ncbi:F-box protein [Phanerochaete sordida]|uniref:F-box protein n=1 Tax=Phanerochaete sordida TaxID=48140 RepID=A0A9P3GE01_9APHY|nr:F-box protein [Phanerochaete sordida]
MSTSIDLSSLSSNGELPTELLVDVLEHLSLAKLVQLQLVCRNWKTIIQAVPSLQYQIELGLAGLENNPSNTLDTATKRKMLAKYHEAWFSCDRPIFDPRKNMHHLVLSDRRVTRGKVMPASSWGGIFEMYFASSEYSLVVRLDDLRSQYLGTQKSSVILGSWEPEEKSHAAVDATQDLVILLREASNDSGLYLHCVKLSTGETHPLSGFREMSHLLPPVIHEDMIINGPYVALYRKSTHVGALDIYPYVLVWNWKTGRQILHDGTARIFDITFLSNKHIALARTMQSATSTFSVPAFSIIDLEERERALTSSVVSMRYSHAQWTFLLPEINERASAPLSLMFKAAPTTQWVPCPSAEQPAYFTKQEERAMVIGVYFNDKASGKEVGIRFVTLASRILKLINNDELPCTRTYPWFMWGPAATRAEPLGYHDSQPSASQPWGLRFSELVVCHHQPRRSQARFVLSDRVTSPTEIWDSRRSHGIGVAIYDFNQVAIRKAVWDSTGRSVSDHLSDTTTPAAPWEGLDGYSYHVHPSCLPPQYARYFDDPDGVRTELPYRKRTTDLRIKCPLSGAGKRGLSREQNLKSCALFEDHIVVDMQRDGNPARFAPIAIALNNHYEDVEA